MGKSGKPASWVLSVFLHVAAGALIARSSIPLAFPEGNVASDHVTIETFEAAKGIQKEVPSEAKELRPVNVPKPKDDGEEAVAPKVARKKQAPQPAKKVAVRLPEKPAERKEESKPVETQQDSPVEVPTPEDLKTQVAENDEVKKDIEPKPEEKPAPDPIPAPVEEEKAQTTQVEPAPKAAPQAVEKKEAVSAKNEVTPRYGTPGEFIDEANLAEVPGNPKPNYPYVARLRRQQGMVLVRAYIRKDGKVDLPILERSSGYPVLDHEAVKAYAQWRYQPGASGWVIKPFKFTLNN